MPSDIHIWNAAKILPLRKYISVIMSRMTEQIVYIRVFIKKLMMGCHADAQDKDLRLPVIHIPANATYQRVAVSKSREKRLLASKPKSKQCSSLRSPDNQSIVRAPGFQSGDKTGSDECHQCSRGEAMRANERAYG